MFLVIMNQILKMILLLGVGIVCFRLKLIDQEGNRSLTNLLLKVVSPALAISSLQIEYRPELTHGLVITYGLAILIHIIAILTAHYLIPKKGNPHFDLERFSVTYANCGFIGIPLIQSILGAEGIFYLTAYITVFNFLTWTHGIILMTGQTSVKQAVKGLLSPMIIACALGLLFFLAQIRLPAVPADVLSYLGSMNTPLAMLIAGVSVAQTNVGELLRTKRVYLVSAMRLLLVPALTFCLLLFLPVPGIVKMVVLVVSACPVGTTGTAFALQFHKDYRYASELYTLTTIACLITIPMFVALGDHLF